MKFLEIFKGNKNEFSHKRFVGVIGAFVLFGTMVYNNIHPQSISPDAELIQAVEFVVIACIGSTAIEKFANKDGQG
mgnify:FL=1|tara:strand:+ start:1336 stop:1563 length:228 start_codon:yes stop_codon:yes gene_type:complete